MVDIAVIDYGMGNLRSVQQALHAVAPGASIAVTDDPRVVEQAGRVVFPGQGAMPDCMRELDARGLRGAVLAAANSKPFLGICIGLQMLFEHSAEGDVKGLGVLPGRVVRFAHDLRDAQGNKLKVPHMGWNQVHHGEHPLWQGIAQDARFYFVHSYYVQTEAAGLVQGQSNYPQPFVCAVARDKLFAVQFHPEKSHAAGLQLLKNFVSWNPV
ncbi:MAG TPA: imidazole glycerol phosphate synthase subunit HisH [Gallionellaceae bacterium]|nr:imidazole glycerol phosphate synthase subunit HisH [Gallionellaceae bacterium]